MNAFNGQAAVAVHKVCLWPTSAMAMMSLDHGEGGIIDSSFAKENVNR